ncbi:MAG: cyclic nucleotide-binding domain-containing protein [Pseudomonadota bacterium]
MELTFASAFSTGGMVGHLAYILLIASMLMRRMVWLRVLVIASALVAIAYAVIWLNDPVSSFWETLLVLVNIVQLLITWRQNTTTRFSTEELEFAKRRLRGLPPYHQRKLLGHGHWVDLHEGQVLTQEGKHPDRLYYISEGSASVEVNDQTVATCGPGSYIGEMGFISGEPASALVCVRKPTRAWSISREALVRIDKENPTWMSVIEAGIARDLRLKIIAANDIRTV